MYHQLNRMTGRLVAATHLQNPLFPIAPSAIQRVEVPVIQYNTNQLSTVAEACPAPQRRTVPGTNIPYGQVPESIRQKQKLFQKEDDVPVFLKGGPADSLLYRFTLFLCILGVIGAAENIYTYAKPKK